MLISSPHPRMPCATDAAGMTPQVIIYNTRYIPNQTQSPPSQEGGFRREGNTKGGGVPSLQAEQNQHIDRA